MTENVFVWGNLGWALEVAQLLLGLLGDSCLLCNRNEVVVVLVAMRLSAILTLFSLVLVQGASAQRVPDVGYVYPAGGQRGTEIVVTVGGQYLDGVNGASVTGEGVRAEVLDHEKPIPPGLLNELRQKLGELNGKLNQGQITRAEIPEQFQLFAQSKGLEDFTLADFRDLRARERDPKRQPNAQLEEKVTLRVTIAEDAELGNRELRLATPRGLTAPLVFQVGQFPEVREDEPNDIEEGVELPGELPLVINGQILPGDVDRFRFRARKNTRLVASVEARSLIPYLADAVPGWFQATLSLKDAAGTEGAYSDDHGFDPDPIISCRIPGDGEYVLEIHDAIYRGREDFVYRIVVGKVPLITSVFPLGCRAGEEVAVELAGWNLRGKELDFKSEGMSPGVVPLTVHARHYESNPVKFSLGELAEVREAEPNNTPAEAQVVEAPLTINGRVEKPGDADVYEFAGQKGQKIVAEVRARRLGSALDSFLKITGPDGSLIGANDDFADPGAGLTTHQADSRVEVTLPAEGRYYLSLFDAQGQGGPEHGYRLHISPPRPGFALRVVPSSISGPVGGHAPVTVYALRHDGYEGPIDLSLVDMPPGFTLNGGPILAGMEKLRLTVGLPNEPTAEPVPLRIEGRAQIDGIEVSSPAVPADDQMQAFLYRHLVPSQEGLVQVTGKGRRRLDIHYTSRLPVRIPVGGMGEAHVSIPRPLLQRLTLELNEPPPGVTLKNTSSRPFGAVIALGAEGEKVEPGQRGNLIIEAFNVRKFKDRQGNERSRRVSVGFLPSLPYEITPPLSSLLEALEEAPDTAAQE